MVIINFTVTLHAPIRNFVLKSKKCNSVNGFTVEKIYFSIIVCIQCNIKVVVRISLHREELFCI